MKKKLQILTTLLVIFSLSTYGQFIKEYYKSAANAVNFQAIVPASNATNSNLYAIGNYGTQMIVAELKQSGNIVWTKRLMVNDVDYMVNSMFVDIDGNLVFAGAEALHIDDDGQGFVGKFDPVTQTLLWFRQTDQTVIFYDITEGAPGGAYYASGQEEDQGTGNQADHVVFSVDRNTGAMSMISNLNKHVNETAECVVYDPTGASIYTAGRYELEVGASKFRIVLSKMDTSGVIDFSKYYIKSLGTSSRFYAQDMIIDDSSIVIVGFGDDNGTSTFESLFFIKISLSGEIQSTIKYNITTTATDGILASIKKHADGYVLYGHGYTVGEGDVFLMNVDINGSVVWAKSYNYRKHPNPNGYYTLSSLALIGNYIFHVGQRTMLDGTVRGVLLRAPIATGDAGTCDVSLTVTSDALPLFQASTTLDNASFTSNFPTLSINVKNHSLNTQTTCSVNGKESEDIGQLDFSERSISEISILPNPAVGSFSIVTSDENIYKELTIFNALGQIVYYKNEPIDEEEMVDINGWVPGIYQITLKATSGELFTERLVIN